MFEKPTPQSRWVEIARINLRVGLVLAVVYLGVTYYQRWTSAPIGPERKQTIKLHPDLYVFPPKSYVTDVASARKLIGKPLWVKEGYRWVYEPGDDTLGPLERLVPSGVKEKGEHVFLEFHKDGATRSVAIGRQGKFYIDDMFLLEDPRSLWDHWSEQDWDDIAKHKIRAGMSEYQVVFALGAGSTVQSSRHAKTRIVHYVLGSEKGVGPFRVTFRDTVVERFEPLEN